MRFKSIDIKKKLTFKLFGLFAYLGYIKKAFFTEMPIGREERVTNTRIIKKAFLFWSPSTMM